MRTEWNGFIGGDWEHEINVRDFIQKNYHPYDGDEAFLAGPTQNTLDLWDEVLELSRKEREAGGVLDIDVYKRQLFAHYITFITDVKVQKNVMLFVSLCVFCRYIGRLPPMRYNGGICDGTEPLPMKLSL